MEQECCTHGVDEKVQNKGGTQLKSCAVWTPCCCLQTLGAVPSKLTQQYRG
jgi:hypothetical protein